MREFSLFGVSSGTPDRAASAPPSSSSKGRYVTRAERDRFVNERLVVQDHVDLNSEIIEEREEAMRDIHKNLVEVREVFADLAELVQDQDHSIKLIEEHVDNSRAKAREGVEELHKADKYQRQGCSVS